MEQRKQSVDVILFNPGDHPSKTPLCSGQEVHYDRMESDVLVKIKDVNKEYLDYFQATR